MPTQVPRYTAAEVRTFPGDHVRFEVIRGELFVTPAPGTPHQRLVGALFATLRAYLARHGLGEALVAPFEVELAHDTAVQPDVLVLLGNARRRLTRARLSGPPSLVIEVVSYSSKRTDRLQKRALYQAEGIGEYWIVDPDLRRVERWVPGVSSPGIVTGHLTWRPAAAVAPLVIPLDALFEEAWEGL